MKYKKAFYLILFIACIALFNSCLTEKKAVKQTNRNIAQYPDTTRAIFRARWPFIITNKPTDSTEFKKYLSEIDRIAAELEAEKNKLPQIDTFPLFVEDEQKIEILQNNLAIERAKFHNLSVSYLELKKLCKERPPLRDTIKIADSSAIDEAYAVTNRIIKAKDKELAQALKEKDKADKKIKFKNQIIWFLSIGLSIFLIPFLIRLIAKR